MKRKTTAALTGLAVATAAVVLGTGGASQAAGSKSYAYGFDIVQGGESQVRQPYVESTDGSTQEQGGHLPAEAEPLISGGVIALTAGDDQASFELANLDILNIGDQLPPEAAEGLEQLTTQLQQACDGIEQIPLEQIPNVLEQLPIGGVAQQPTKEEVVTFCEDLLDADLPSVLGVELLNVECTGDDGTVTIAGASVLGADAPVLEGAVEPNTAVIPENPGLNITANRQTANPDGSYTVDGLVIGLSDQVEIILGSATCGEPIAQAAPDPEGPPPAPAPEPVVGNLPVTG